MLAGPPVAAIQEPHTQEFGHRLGKFACRENGVVPPFPGRQAGRYTSSNSQTGENRLRLLRGARRRRDGGQGGALIFAATGPPPSPPYKPGAPRRGRSHEF